MFLVLCHFDGNCVFPPSWQQFGKGPLLLLEVSFVKAQSSQFGEEEPDGPDLSPHPAPLG